MTLTWGRTGGKAALPPSLFGMRGGQIVYKIMPYQTSELERRYRISDKDGRVIEQDFRSSDAAKERAMKIDEERRRG